MGIGNLNAARSILPALARLRKGKPLPDPFQRVTVIADRKVRSLAADKPDMTAAETLMQNDVVRPALQAVYLIIYEMAQHGAIVQRDGVWDLQPGVQRLPKFLQEVRMGLIALGLGRRAKDVGSLDALLADATKGGEVDV